ncbi:type II toxin-antitoxin system prevent-host-death family antitoxin [Azospirillum sp.]|uniref:type II toxin-antitoxin system Phd/YefM family antitoxin n=1 Tax=Azospirillum sp. TaxID=34012 RepID=UPI002D63194F|nr:type II toxin-antitoxin system prevent-host-death family antitoxin [Azospirillum sp.]HYD66918.1 type II toxin-antitoxin system prevent-host-death family antitoxin [Azospirillum sp.]
MTILVPIDEAKAMLAELCARAREGEEIVLTENGTPVGRIGPMERPPRPLGTDAGKIRMHDNFDDPLPCF